MLCSAGDPTPGRSGDSAREAGLTSPSGAVPILVVEDDVRYCEAIGRALEPVPLRPFAVHTAAAAHRFLSQPDVPRPAFIVLDFNLPDAKAPAVLGDLRADIGWRDIPVLVLTQIAGDADERASLAAGAQAYREKPSRVAPLRELLVDFWKTYAGRDGDPDRR